MDENTKPQPTADSPAPPDTDATGEHGTRVQNDAEARIAAGRGVALSVPGFELIEEIGRGGMGCVWRAKDLGFHRDVAIKVLRAKTPTPQATKRFLDEAQLTGQLQHPGIPAVHQVGRLADGQPFLAMKLIRGRSLSRLLNEGTVLNVPAIFESICQAVGCAHAHGVIHRDLKPDNVMVGAFGEVQVMDWGLAKFLGRGESHETGIELVRDQDDLTQAGAVMGTVAYMPPEQARGDLDRLGPPADVFGLGAILCAMITGKPPYLNDADSSSFEKAQEGNLAEAHARLDASTAERELVALCKQCLAAEPEERPADGQTVATRVAMIRAAADDRARRAEVDLGKAEVRVQEQRRRRRIQFTLGAAIVAVSLVGGGIAVWKAIDARKARDATALEARNARQDLAFFINSLSQASAEAVSGTGRKFVNPNPTVKDALDYTAQSLTERYAGQPLREAEIRAGVGRIYFQLHHYPQAAAQYERVLDSRRHHLPPADRDVLNAANDLGLAYVKLKSLDAARPLLQEALSGRRQLLGEHEDTFQTLNNLGLLAWAENDLPAAEGCFREALDGRMKLLGPDHEDTLKCVNNLGLVLFAGKQYGKAEPLLQQVREGRKKKYGEGYSSHPAYIDAVANLAQLYYWWERPDSLALTVPLFREAVELSERINPDGWETAKYRRVYAESLIIAKSYDEADVQIHKAFHAMKNAKGIEQNERNRIINDIINTGDELYKVSGNKNKSDTWQQLTVQSRSK